jgi:hypothetical protein
MDWVLQVYFWDYTGSLDNPNMDTRSGITNYHSDLCIGSVWLDSGQSLLTVTSMPSVMTVRVLVDSLKISTRSLHG